MLHNLNKTLWEQLVALVQPPLDNVYILSRYFDSSPQILNRIVADVNPHKLRIFTQNGITTMTTSWLSHDLFKEGLMEINLCTYMDQEHHQPLHAKGMIFEKDNEYTLVFGSANFTTPALFTTFPNGNIETILVVKNIHEDDLQPELLFDPLGKATILELVDQLHTSPKDSPEGRDGFEIFLREAMLSDNTIRMSVQMPDQIICDYFRAQINTHDGGQLAIPVHDQGANEYLTESIEEIVGALHKSPCSICLETVKDDKVVARSNPVLVINLSDIHTGEDLVKKRYRKEAENSAIEFFDVLKDLIADGDERSLITFLNFCDIPVTDAARPVVYRGFRTQWDGGEGMKKLGENNLKIFVALHDAAISFIDRHLRKLYQHADRGGINGIANYLHISLAVGAILRSQVERAMQGFETKYQPLSVDEWYAHRQRFDAYFQKFDQLLECLHDRYLPHLKKLYKSESIAEGFAPDIKTLRNLCSDMLAFKQRCKRLISSKLRIRTITGNTVIPPLKDYNIFSDERWPLFEKQQKTRLVAILRNIAA